MDQIIQENHGAILGYLIRVCGSFEDAEDLCQEVILSALKRWRVDGLPDNPKAWLFRAAKNRLIDHHRYHSIRDMVAFDEESNPDREDALNFLDDDLLRLIFTCCHPSIAPDVRVPLTLRSLTGLTLEQVARAFLVSPSAMEQRLVRGKRKIKAAGIAYEIPEGQQLDVRLISVMQTLYLLFNEGYSATSGHPIRHELIREAIRLTTLLQRLLPGRAELMSLLALMLLQHSRTEARIDGDGGLVLLQHQNRAHWDHRMIQQGLAILDKALYLRQAPGIYQLQASIAALHAGASTYEETDWKQITLLYGKLLQEDYSPVLHLNYAVAMAMTGALDQAMLELDELEIPLTNYFPYYCALGDFHHRLSNSQASRDSYERALELECNSMERAFVEKRLAEIRLLDNR